MKYKRDFMPIKTKDRRHSGRYYPDSTLKMKPKEIINDCLEPQIEWNDWNDWRDGTRGYGDKTEYHASSCACYFCKKHNKRYHGKLKKQLAIRKARKFKSNKKISI